MEIQEFPKALYRNGVHTEVQEEVGEEAQRAEGFTDWHTDQERMNRAASATVETRIDEDPAELTVPQMKAELTERGIPFAGNASKAVLKALLDEAQKQ